MGSASGDSRRNERQIKYVIDTDDYKGFAPKYCLVFGDGGYGLDMLDIFTELTAEYVNEHFGELQDDAYNKGLEDAWECARKMLRMCDADLLDIFTECYASVCTASQAIQKYTVHEALAKLTAYEEKQKEDADFCVGDEVQSESGDICIVTKSSVDGYKKQMYVMFDDGSTGEREKVYFHRTGNHYDIADLLAKMREG